MTALLACALLATSANEDKVWEAIPTDDVWVYPHAADPENDPFLRVWGAEDRAVAPSPDAISSYSYSFLRWDTKNLPKGQLVEATLTVWSIQNPGWNVDIINATPLQARGIPAGWDQKTWSYQDGTANVVPDGSDKAVFGTTPKFERLPADKEVALSLDLLKGPADFRAYLKGQTTHHLALALTSALNVETYGMKAILKVHSREAAENLRPKLRLVFREATPVPAREEASGRSR